MTAQPEEALLATPAMVERRLYALSTELDEATATVQQAETDYLAAKTAYELAYAKSYLSVDGKNMKERECRALIACEEERQALVNAEALIKAHKANVQRIYTHVDIARSVSVIVRAGIGAS
jgi:hypothetical protein